MLGAVCSSDPLPGAKGESHGVIPEDVRGTDLGKVDGLAAQGRCSDHSGSVAGTLRMLHRTGPDRY